LALRARQQTAARSETKRSPAGLLALGGLRIQIVRGWLYAHEEDS